MAYVAIGRAGANNAACLAAQMPALADHVLAERLKLQRQANADRVIDKDAELHSRLKNN